MTAPNVFGSLSAGAYQSPGTITGSNVSNFTETAKPGFLGNTGINHNALTQAYDPSAASGTNQTVKSGFIQEAAPPTSPPYWARQKDYYRNGGVAQAGQPFFDNSTNVTPALPATAGGPSQLTDTGTFP